MPTLVQVLAVAEFLNFRHAAAALGVTQSSVSARIKTLEEQLGILIFERRHRGVKLTDSGFRFVSEVSRSMEQLDVAVDKARAISSGKSGRLSIGVNSLVASSFLSRLYLRFRRDFPEVEMVVTEGRSSETIRQLREATLDATFVMGAINSPDCHSRHFWSEDYLVAIPESNALSSTGNISWADLGRMTFLVRLDGAGPQLHHHIVRRLNERNELPNLRRCSVGRDTLMQMIAAGEGITLKNSAVSQMHFPGVVFRQIADEPEAAKFSAIWSPHNRNPALRKLLDLADEMSRSIDAVGRL